MRLKWLLGERHSPSLCAIALGEAISKMTELEVHGRPSEQVAVHCSCECMRCCRGLCEQFGLNLDKERLKVRGRMRARLS